MAARRAQRVNSSLVLAKGNLEASLLFFAVQAQGGAQSEGRRRLDFDARAIREREQPRNFLIGNSKMGSNFRQRREYERAFRDSRMWRLQVGLVYSRVAISQYVDVERARSPALQTATPHFLLDFETQGEQRSSRQIGFDQGRHIEKGGLVEFAPRGRTIDRRRAPQRNARRLAETSQRVDERARHITDIARARETPPPWGRSPRFNSLSRPAARALSRSR